MRVRLPCKARGAWELFFLGYFTVSRLFFLGEGHVFSEVRQIQSLRCKLVCFGLHDLVAEASSKSHATLVAAWFAFHGVPRCLVP